MKAGRAIAFSLAALLSAGFVASCGRSAAAGARGFEPLPAAQWRIQDLGGQLLPNLCDGDPTTGSVVRPPQAGGVTGIVIDLGRACVFQRLYVTGRRSRMPAPNDHAEEVDHGWAGAVKVRVGDSPDGAAAVAEYPLPPQADPTIHCEFSMRFQPVAGRYVRLELAGKLADRPWEIAEVELYGWDSPAALESATRWSLRRRATMPFRWPPPTSAITSGRSSGRAVPVVEPDRAAEYPGTLYRIVDLGTVGQDISRLSEQPGGRQVPGRRRSTSSGGGGRCCSAPGRRGTSSGASGNSWIARASAGSIPTRTATSFRRARA